MSNYSLSLSLNFKVNGVGLAIIDFSEEHLEIEETRKNGQEDTHMSGIMVKDSDGEWVWDECWSFETYEGRDFVEAVQKFINENDIVDALNRDEILELVPYNWL